MALEGGEHDAALFGRVPVVKHKTSHTRSLFPCGRGDIVRAP